MDCSNASGNWFPGTGPDRNHWTGCRQRARLIGSRGSRCDSQTGKRGDQGGSDDDCGLRRGIRVSDRIATTGQVVGSVQDSSGAAVPGVTLKLENAATKAVQTTTAGSDGGFVFPIGSQPLDRLSAACKTHREPRFQV